MRTERHRGHRRAAALTGLALAAATCAWPAAAQAPPSGPPDFSVALPTGQRIAPAGRQVPLDSMPLAAEPSRDGRHLLVLQAGHETPSVTAIDIESGEVASRLELADAWLGLTLNRAGDKVYVSGGARSGVWELSFQDGALALAREFAIAKDCASGDCPALIGDVRLDDDDRTLYALDLLGDRAVVLNAQSGLKLDEIRTGAAPYRARFTPDGEHLAISHWGEASVGLYRLSDRALVERIPVGQHPADLLILPGEVQAPSTGFEDAEDRVYSARLFAASSHADSLWTFGIDENNRFDLLDALPVAPLPQSPLGSLPSALGASADGSTLYIANGGNNSLLVASVEEALPEPRGVIPTGWFPTAVAGLPDGGLAYLNGKGDLEAGGSAALLPALDEEQLEFLTAVAVSTLPGEPQAAPARPGSVAHVALVLSDARGAAWDRLQGEAASLAGYAPPAGHGLGRLAWLTSGMETDFFAKLGPAVAAGRLSERDLAAAGPAAIPAAGTLWSNAADAGVPSEVFGIGGGRPLGALLRKLAGEEAPARLTVVRTTGTPEAQDDALGELLDAFRRHPAYPSTALFVVPASAATGAAVAGGAVAAGGTDGGAVSAPSVLRTIEWILDLRPMTQFDATAPVLSDLFATGR